MCVCTANTQQDIYCNIMLCDCIQRTNEHNTLNDTMYMYEGKLQAFSKPKPQNIYEIIMFSRRTFLRVNIHLHVHVPGSLINISF